MIVVDYVRNVGLEKLNKKIEREKYVREAF